MARFKRILLKLSGESLMGKQGYGIDPERLSDYARQIKEVSEMGVQIGIVIGGGNVHRSPRAEAWLTLLSHYRLHWRNWEMRSR